MSEKTLVENCGMDIEMLKNYELIPQNCSRFYQVGDSFRIIEHEGNIVILQDLTQFDKYSFDIYAIDELEIGEKLDFDKLLSDERKRIQTRMEINQKTINNCFSNIKDLEERLDELGK